MLPKKNIEAVLFSEECVYLVAQLIFDSPNTKFHLRKLARDTKFSTTAITDAIELLLSLDIVKIEITALTKNVTANLESPNYYFYKRIFNLLQLKKYKITEILQKIFPQSKAIVLFGSYARGEDIETSDIDIFVVAKDHRTDEQKTTDSVALDQFKELKRKVALQVLPLEKSSPEFKNTLANGIVLYGYLKVI